MTLKDISKSIGDFFRRESTITHGEMMMLTHTCL